MTLRNALSAAIAVTLAISLSACSSGKDGSAPVKGSTKLVGTAWDTAAADKVKSGGTLDLPIDQLPDNYNDQVRTDKPVDLATIAPTRGNAIAITADGSWKVDPNYAESVELVDKDPQVVEVKLNKKAVWSDGKPITAADMISFWKAMNGSNKDFEVASTVGYQDIKSVKQGGDEYAYKVEFRTKNADWPNYIYPKLPASVAKSAKAFNKGYGEKAVPGNGPFMISKLDRAGKTITEIRNPRWWGTKPKLSKIVFRAIDPSRQAQQFADKKLDALEVDQDKGSYDIAKQRDGARFQRANGLSWTHLTFNSTRGPLKDVKVRRAIAHALDRRQMSATLNKPVGAPAVELGSMIYVPGQKGYRDNAAKAIGFDTGKSESLLEDAGYKKADNGLYAKDGKPLELSITIPSDTPSNSQRARAIQRYLKGVGITVKLDTVPTEKYFDNYLVPLNFEMATFTWEGGPFPITARQPLFYPVDSGQNFTGTTDPRLEDLWGKANSESDPDERIKIANEIDEVLFDYVPLVPIAPSPIIFAVGKGLVNYGASQFEYPDYTKVGFSK